ncbi:MAG: hypothetical protein ACRYGG_05125 [Janthinobacterium lividum]
MHIKFKVGKFLEALDIAELTVDKKGNLDTKDIFVSAVKSEGVVYMYSTDFTNQSVTKITDITVLEDGSLPLTSKQLYVALSKRGMDDEVTIKNDSKGCKISVGRSKFTLGTSNSQTLMARLESVPMNGDVLVEISAEDLIDVFKRSKVCVSTDVNNTNRSIMRGIHIKNQDKSYVVEATDGFSGSSITLEQSKVLPEIDIIIPGEFTSILLNLCGRAKKSKTNLQIIKTNHLYFKFDNIIVSTSVMIGKFPAITQIIDMNKHPSQVDVDSTTLKSGLNRILGFEGFSSQSADLIGLEVRDKTLVIKAKSTPDCEEVVDFGLDLTPPAYTAKVNGRRLLDILSSSTLGTATLGIPDVPSKPLYFEEVIPNKLTARYVIMPTR